jgi:hypothetical protein
MAVPFVHEVALQLPSGSIDFRFFRRQAGNWTRPVLPAPKFLLHLPGMDCEQGHMLAVAHGVV